MEQRDIKADYVKAYREQFDTAVAAGKLGHARRVAHALEGLGVKVTVPKSAAKETTAAKAPAETTAERRPAEDEAKAPAGEKATEAKPAAESKPAAKKAAASRGGKAATE
jgi:hypothetical protein